MVAAVGAPAELVDVLRSCGELSKDQVAHLLCAAGYPHHPEAVWQTLDPQSTGSVHPETLLSWLYPSAAEPEATQQEAPPQELPQQNATESASPRAAYCPTDVEKMKAMMEVESSLQEANTQYRQMALKLAEDFRSRGRAPQAEAFIEQVCVEKILEGCVFVGHVKTDLDSVAGAIGAACLWNGVATRAERELNGEIMFALKWSGTEMPPFFDDVPGAAAPDASGNLLKICLVDHNEEKQMVDALRKDKQRSKRICGLIDHHCLSESFSSEKPVFMDIRPWGSMCSIVAHSFIRSNRPIPRGVARILLTAILSDTLNLQSVTTTTADRMLVTLLAILGEVEDTDALARQMFRAKTEWILNLGAYEMTRGDQKDFTCAGWKVGIAVLEVTDMTPVLEVADELIMELRILKIEKGKTPDGGHDRRRELDFAFLFVVDVAAQRSNLLICGHRELLLAQAAFLDRPLREAKPGIMGPGASCRGDQTLMDVGAIVSRKAEFVPAFFQALTKGFECHKTPMSSVSEEVAKMPPTDEIYLAFKKIEAQSFHDSVCVVRDYSGFKEVLEKRQNRPAPVAA